MPTLSVQPAPLTALLPVLLASALDRQERGEPLWLPESLSAERLAHQYPDGQGHLGVLDGEPVAAMILLPDDPDYWPDDPPGEALYLHKLAVHPGWQGRGLGGQMIAAAVALTRAAGRPWLRLDTAADRPRLRASYEAQGFGLVKEGVMGRWPAAWYELRV